MSTFKSASFNDTVPVEILSADGASELAVVNGAFNLIGRGIGKLNLDLPRGIYQVRQSIGTAVTTSNFEVPIDHPQSDPMTITLDPIVFSTPAPIAGTKTFRAVPADMWLKPDQLVGRPGLRIVLRAPVDDRVDELPSPASLAHVEAEIRRLRLETLAGALVVDFATATLPQRFQTTALFVEDLALAPGHYVLVQASDAADAANGWQGRQRCLPLVVHRDFSPRIYLLSLIDETTQSGLGVNLDNAGIIYWPSSLASSPDPADLRLVEAARKALSRGQGMGGYLDARRDAVNPDMQSPMLALMDAYLTLGGSQPDQAAAAIDAAAQSLGEDFPDVVALRCAYQSLLSQHEGNAVPAPSFTEIRLSGPPMLSLSWRQLLQTEALNEQMARVMPFSFRPELTGAWLTWNEPMGARIAGPLASSDQPGAAGQASSQATTLLLQTAAAALVALMSQKVVDEAVTRMRQLLAEQESLPADQRLDPLAMDLIHGLCRMQDQFLIDAFGAREVAVQVLTSLSIPSDRYPALLATLEKLFAESGPTGSILARLTKPLIKLLSAALHAIRG